MQATSNTPALFEVINQFKKIKVDDYQRTYAWTREEIDELFEDLNEAAQSGDYHFFGSLIFQSHDNSEATVVDGQQRLTTIFILIAALRDEMIRIGKDTLPPGQENGLPIRVIDKAWAALYSNLNDATPRFESNRFLKGILLDSVYPQPSQQAKIADRDSSVTLNFRKAIKTVRKLVSDDLAKRSNDDLKLSRINDLLDTIRERFLVLRVVTASLSESLEIFLTMNNRGLPLGPSDLVRGEIMRHLSEGESEKSQSVIHRKIFEEWKDIAENVKDAEAFLRHYLVATGSTKVQKRRVFEVVQDRIKGADSALRKDMAQTFWDGLMKASELYRSTISPKMGGNTQYFLEMMHGLMKSHRILFLTILDPDFELSSSQVEEVARLTYALTFRWNMAGMNAQKLEDLFQKWGQSFRQTKNYLELKTKIRDEASDISFDVEKYLAEEGDSDFIGKAILHGINRALTPGANSVPLNKDLHLEHIAPQTSTDHWRNALFFGNADSFENYEKTIQAIGNLTLLDERLNMQAKQLPFSEKKPKYNKSVMKISRDLTDCHSWTIEEIDHRTTWVAEMFELVVAVEPSQGTVVPFAEWLKSRPSN